MPQSSAFDLMYGINALSLISLINKSEIIAGENTSIMSYWLSLTESQIAVFEEEIIQELQLRKRKGLILEDEYINALYELINNGVYNFIRTEYYNKYFHNINIIKKYFSKLEKKLETFNWGNTYYVTNWKNILEELDLKRRQDVISEDDYLNKINTIIDMVESTERIVDFSNSMLLINWMVLEREASTPYLN